MPSFRNFTPHTVLICDDQGHVVASFDSEGSARVSTTPGQVVERYGPIAIREADTIGEPYGLPDPEPNTYVIVSAMVAQHAPDRTDLLVPGTAPADRPVRDEAGHIYGVRVLKRVHAKLSTAHASEVLEYGQLPALGEFESLLGRGFTLTAQFSPMDRATLMRAGLLATPTTLNAEQLHSTLEALIEAGSDRTLTLAEDLLNEAGLEWS